MMQLSDFLFTDIKLRNDKILYLDIDIDLEKKFKDQLWSYKEDMLQIEYGNGNSYIIDVGWIPEHDEGGSFVLTVIKDFNWGEPLVSKKIKDIYDLKKNLEIEHSKLELK